MVWISWLMHLFFHTVFALLASTANSEKSSSRSFSFAGAAGGFPPGKNCGHCEKLVWCVAMGCMWLLVSPLARAGAEMLIVSTEVSASRRVFICV